MRYPCKTLVSGRECRKEVQAQAAHVAIQVETPDETRKPTRKLAKVRRRTEEDGYARGIRVKQHAFCCRIMKRAGTAKFDRARSENWYRAMLSKAIPEIAALPLLKGSPDIDFVKHFFLSRCMNIRRNFAHEGTEHLGNKPSGVV